MPSAKPDLSRLVYSTEAGRICPECRCPVAACNCGRPAQPPPGDGIVRVALDTKGRNGKGVTLIRGAPLGDADLAALGKQLKAACGSGGTVKQGVIEVQGDHRERIVPLLAARGWIVKRVGG